MSAKKKIYKTAQAAIAAKRAAGEKLKPVTNAERARIARIMNRLTPLQKMAFVRMCERVVRGISLPRAKALFEKEARA